MAVVNEPGSSGFNYPAATNGIKVAGARSIIMSGSFSRRARRARNLRFHARPGCSDTQRNR